MCKPAFIILNLDLLFRELLKRTAEGRPFGIALLNHYRGVAAVKQLQALGLAQRVENDLIYGRPRWELTFCGRAAGNLLLDLESNPLLREHIISEYNEIFAS